MNDETISVMLIITVLTPKDLAWFFAKLTDSVSLKGIIKPVTFSEPNAETAKDKVTAESRPPDKPNTTPSDSASATLDLIKLVIISTVSGNMFTTYEKGGCNLNLTILYYYGSIRDYAFSVGTGSCNSWKCK